MIDCAVSAVQTVLAKCAYCAVEAFKLVQAFHRLQLVEIETAICAV